MKIEQNISLRPFNTFGIEAMAKHFASFKNDKDLVEALEALPNEKTMILGGGSNILLTQDFDGLVLKNEIKGIELVNEDDEHVELKIGAGENWHETVLFCIESNFSGIENLSLIPGNCGAAPMQNIGAYGVELKSVFKELSAFHFKSNEIHHFKNEDCQFGYRESIFKNKVKGEYVILHVSLILNKKPTFNTTYGAIQSELDKMGIDELSIRAVSNAVINIRSRKLPNPKEIGNAGSFFKNPVIDYNTFDQIKSEFPNLVSYPSGNKVKLAAGWLIEEAGWKGKRLNDHGVHQNQALVLVNYGNAKGSDIYNLSQKIQVSVKDKFGIQLEREVNII